VRSAHQHAAAWETRSVQSSTTTPLLPSESVASALPPLTEKTLRAHNTQALHGSSHTSNSMSASRRVPSEGGARSLALGQVISANNGDVTQYQQSTTKGVLSSSDHTYNIDKDRNMGIQTDYELTVGAMGRGQDENQLNQGVANTLETLATIRRMHQEQ
jgi:hypothetical protein